MDFLSFFMQIFLRDCVYKPIILCYNICNFILEVRMAKKSKAQKQVEKTVKKTHKATVVLAVLFLLIGIAAGVGASWFLTKDDTFELNGEKVIRLTVGDTYEEQGAKHYNALQCYKGENGAQRVYELSDGIKMEILYQEFYENKSSDENNYSVCLMFNQGDKHFLFTGDLEEDGEISLVESNELPKVELFKAGHHGSKTSSNDVLLKVIEPEIVCVCCCAGSVEYTQNFENTFPTQAMIDRVSLYTDRVYVTTVGEVVYNADKEKYEDNGFGPLNGNIVVTSNKSGVNVQCSHDNAVLKDTKWFKDNRTMPSAWS